jgi:anaerobic nitric oxide reductase transcription regulator
MLRAALRATDAHTAVAVMEPLHLDGLGHVDETPRQSVSLTAESKGSLAKRVDGFQAQLIRSTLLELGDNWAETARRLQIDLGNLHRLAKRLGLKGSG